MKRAALCAIVALFITMTGCETSRKTTTPPNPQDAFDYAISAVLLTRVAHGNQIHSYVKEVWRFDSRAGMRPEIGAEYGEPKPHTKKDPHAERDAVAFKFGVEPPTGLPHELAVRVPETGIVPFFKMSVDDLRTAFKATQPKA